MLVRAKEGKEVVDTLLDVRSSGVSTFDVDVGGVCVDAAARMPIREAPP